MNRKLLIGMLILGVAAISGGVWAYGIPTTNPLVYSGTLLNNGAPVDGDKFILIKVWNGAQLACSTIPSGNTTIIQGRFSIPLDASCVDVVHQHPDVQVEVVVDGQSLGKTGLSAVPYAVEADTASNPAPGSAIEALVPAGTIVAYGGVVGDGTSPPLGWLFCDGRTLTKADYPRLALAIGTNWGNGGDGATKFNLPDLRGRFLRGVTNGATTTDGGTLRDPDALIRDRSNPGGNTGDAVGTVQGPQFQSHNHRFFDTNGVPITIGRDAAAWSGIMPLGATYNGAGALVLSTEGGNETRPINAAVNYIIKY